MKTVYVLNGPNLNLLTAEGDSLADVERRLRDRARRAERDLVFLQTNHEGDLVDWIQEAGAAGAPVILNAGVYAHTSLALADAIRGAGTTVVEIRLGNAQAHDSGRRRSYIASVARGVIMGFGTTSYDLAFDALLSGEGKQSE